MRNTKIYIQFKEIQHKKWHFASCIVDSDVETIEEAEVLLECGNMLNHFIKELVDISERQALFAWEVIEVDKTTAKAAKGVIIGDKPKSLVEFEKELKRKKRQLKAAIEESKKADQRLEDAKTKHASLTKKLEEVNADNIRMWVEDWGLTHAKAVWASENYEFLMKRSRHFKLTPDAVRGYYAKAHGVKASPSPEAFLPIREVKTNGEFIKVLDTLVPKQLFVDYVSHLDKTAGCKIWDSDEYENKRAILHERLFKALGCDRFKRDKGRGREAHDAIIRIVKSVERCMCGGRMDAYKRCFSCGKEIGLKDFLFNLEIMSKKDSKNGKK